MQLKKDRIPSKNDKEMTAKTRMRMLEVRKRRERQLNQSQYEYDSGYPLAKKMRIKVDPVSKSLLS